MITYYNKYHQFSTYIPTYVVQNYISICGLSTVLLSGGLFSFLRVNMFLIVVYIVSAIIKKVTVPIIEITIISAVGNIYS